MTATPFLTNPAPDVLAGAVEGNLMALFRTMATSLGGDLIESATLSQHHTSPSNPMFKGAWGARLTAATAESAIDATLAWFEARGAPFAFWWTGPSTRPADLGARLTARGLVAWEAAGGAPGMTASLANLAETSPSRLPSGFTVEVVADDQALVDFGQAFVTAYAVPAWAGQAWVDATRQIGLDRAPWRLYLGREQGTPVATALLFLGAGVAGLYAIGTIPAARGRGIGSAITLAPLLEAREAGCHYAVLFATEMAVSLYTRLGFQDCGSRINRYLWRHPGQAAAG